jgi:uncharacterized protein (TIGR02246 family)
MRRIALGILGVLLLSAAAFATTQGRGAEDETAIRDLVARYVAAREARDASAIRALFTEDIDQLVSSGEWRRGRDGVVSGTLESSARTRGRRTITVESIRFVSADVALADGRYQIENQGDGTTRRMWTAFVMVRREDGWKMAAIRNMLPAPQAGSR